MAMFSPEMLGLGGMMAFLGAFLVFALIIGVAFYVYYALALSTIAKKLKYNKPWLAWIPFANISLVLILGGFHWALVFLLLIPVLGWIALAVIAIIATWRIYEKRNYPGWLALIPLAGFIPILGWLVGVANLVILGLVAWADRK